MAIGEKSIPAENFVRVSAEMTAALMAGSLMPVMREMKLIAEEAIAVNFLESQEASGAAWAKRKRDYPWPILIKTGHLMRSATTEGEADHIESIGDRDMMTGTAVPYASYHQYGTERMVARPFEAVPDSAVDEMEDLLAEYIIDAIFEGT